MAFAGGMCVFPGGGVDPRDFDHAVGVGRPVAGGVGRSRSAPTRRPPGPWSAPPCARPSRSPASCWPASPSDTVVADTTGDDWESDRAALEARELSFTDFLDRRGLVLRTDLLGVWAGVADAGLRAASLPHLVLRGRPARGPAHPRRVDRVRPGHLAAGRCRRSSDVEQEQMFMLPPTYLTCLEIGAVRRPGRRARRGAAGAPSRCSCRRSRRTTRAGRSRSPGTLETLLATPVDELVRRHLRRAGPLRARAQREHDDPRRHQHLGAARARCAPLGRDRSRVRPTSPTSTAVAEQAGDVAVVLLTHHHLDHSEAAREFAERMGCGVRALDPEYRLGSEGLGRR